jgi:hypothetical protein
MESMEWQQTHQLSKDQTANIHGAFLASNTQSLDDSWSLGSGYRGAPEIGSKTLKSSTLENPDYFYLSNGLRKHA